jgi:hypothetical protein
MYFILFIIFERLKNFIKTKHLYIICSILLLRIERLKKIKKIKQIKKVEKLKRTNLTQKDIIILKAVGLNPYF